MSPCYQVLFCYQETWCYSAGMELETFLLLILIFAALGVGREVKKLRENMNEWGHEWNQRNPRAESHAEMMSDIYRNDEKHL